MNKRFMSGFIVANHRQLLSAEVFLVLLFVPCHRQLWLTMVDPAPNESDLSWEVMSKFRLAK